MAQPKDPAASGEKGGMRIDTNLVRELATLLSDNELTEIEVADGDRRIKVKRETQAFIATAPAAPAPQAFAAPPAQAKDGAASGAPAAEEVSGTTVKSPMVGTAFLSPEPSANPFIEVGKAVKAGDTLLIVEAMKVMNPITSPRAGKVVQMLVENGQPVEFDQPLAIVE